MGWIVIGIVSVVGFGVGMIGTHTAVEHHSASTEHVVEHDERDEKPMDELETDRFRSYSHTIRNPSGQPKRFVVENDDGERIEFTIKHGYKYYIER